MRLRGLLFILDRGFLHFELKKAISAGLFFVVFSSISGLISLSIAGQVAYLDGIVIDLHYNSATL